LESNLQTLPSSHHIHQGFNNKQKPMQPSPKKLTATTLSIILMAIFTIATVNQITKEVEQIITVATSIPTVVTTAEMATEAAGNAPEQTTSPTTAGSGKTTTEKKPEAISTTNAENIMTETITTPLRLCLHYAP
jgi:hypothetical protein